MTWEYLTSRPLHIIDQAHAGRLDCSAWRVMQQKLAHERQCMHFAMTGGDE